MNPRQVSDEEPAAALTNVALFVYTGMTALALLWFATTDRWGLLGSDSKSVLGRLGLADGLLANLGLGTLLGMLVVGLSKLLLSRLSWGEFLESRIREVLRGLRERQAVALALLSGVGEEFLFRGVLLTAFSAWWGTPAGLFLSSVAFGAAHVGPDRRFLLWTAFSFCMGLVLGGLLLATGSLWAPVAVHVTVNGLNLLEEVWERRLFPEGHSPLEQSGPRR